MNKNLYLFKKRRKTDLKKQKTHANCFFSKPVFFNPDYLPILFSDFPLIARSGTIVTSLSV